VSCVHVSESLRSCIGFRQNMYSRMVVHIMFMLVDKVTTPCGLLDTVDRNVSEKHTASQVLFYARRQPLPSF
jgi:hypothetical protein